MKKKEPAAITFSWRNYTKPTPRNLKLFMEFWKGLTVVITGASIFQHADEWVSISILVFGYVVDRLAKFFANVEAEEAKKQIVVEVPIETDVKIAEQTVSKNEEIG
jgi:predicted membrane-bound mannosyltransferase